jgi:hypothetical protein
MISIKPMMNESKPFFYAQRQNWRSSLLLMLLTFGAALLFQPQASAATVRAYVQPSNARPNQVINYVITVQDGQAQSLPNLRFPLQIGQTSGVSTSQQISIVNGRQTASQHLSWGIVATEPGEFVIPPQTIIVDGQPLTTNEVKLTVDQGGGPAANDPNAEDKDSPLLQIELGKKEIYQGEVVPVNCSLYVPRQTQLRRLGLIEIEKSDFAIARFPQTNEQSSTVIDGVGYYVLTFRSTLSSLRTGDLKVGPASLEMLVEVPMEGQRQMLPPGFPQGFFGGASEPRKMVVKSQQVTLKVLPLPAEGKPANFSGAVGEFQMSATATPTELMVGDPVSVEIAVSGAGNFDALSTPALVSSGGWKLYPAKRYNIEGPIDQNQTPTLERKVGYSQVLIPEAVHPSVPPFELNYFSPAEKKYINLRTEAIPLVMTPAPANSTAEASPATGTAVVAELPPPVVDPQADITDILINPSVTSRWISATPNLLLTSKAFWSAQAAPLVLFAIASFMALARRRRDEKKAGRAGELRQAWEQLEKNEVDDHVFLRHAAQFIQTVKGAEVIHDASLQKILDRYANTNFSGQAAQPVSAEEKREMKQTLAGLFKKAMTALSLILITFFSLGSAIAEEAAKGASTPDQVYEQAIAELEKSNFTKAQYLAESLTKKEPPQLSPEVFEIIGHARYRQKDLGRAALWYQRAQLLDGRTPELRQNLRHLFEQTRYLSFTNSSPFVDASTALTLNEWLMLASLGLWLIFLPLIWRTFRRNTESSWPAVIITIGVLLLLPAAAFAAIRPSALERVKDISVITQPDVDSYTAATVTSGSVIPLPPGSQVRLLEKRGTWFYVEIPSQPENLRGWVEAAALSPLWPWETNLVP